MRNKKQQRSPNYTQRFNPSATRAPNFPFSFVEVSEEVKWLREAMVCELNEILLGRRVVNSCVFTELPE